MDPVSAPAPELAPAEGEEIGHAPAERPSVTINILSPSAEIPNRLSLTNLSVGLSVGELKEKIRDAVASGPLPARQRLIYQGRVLARDGDTMTQIFGEATLRESSTQTLHLVLRPSGESTASAASRQGTPTPAPRANARRPSTRPPQPAQPPPSTGQGQTGTHQAEITVHGSIPNVPLHALGPEVHNMIQNQIQQQLTTHLGHLNQHRQQHAVASQASPEQHNGQAVSAQAQAQPLSNAALGGQAHREQAQPADRVNVSGHTNQTQVRGNEQHEGTRDLNVPTASSPALPGQSPTENQGHNGQRWHVTVNEATAPFPTLQRPAGQFPLPGPGAVPQRFGSPNLPQMHAQGATYMQRSEAGRPLDLNDIRNQMSGIQEEIQRIEQQNAQSGVPPASENMADVRQRLGHLQQNLRTSRSNPAMASERQAYANPNAIRSQSPANISRPAFAMPVLPPGGAPTLPPHSHLLNPPQQPRPFSPTTVYLLSSPSGPYGLLLSPNGNYQSTPNPTPNAASSQTRRDPVPRAAHSQVQGQRPADRVPHVPTQLPTQRNAPHNQNQNQNHAQQAQVHAAGPPRNENQIRDQLRALFPLGAGGTLWLIVRVAFFIFFFGGSLSHWRSLLIPLLAGIMYGIQVGLFGGLMDLLPGSLRRHIEGLLPLDHRRIDQQRPQQEGAIGAGRRAANNRPQQGHEEAADPDPATLVERLTNLREERDRQSLVGSARHHLRTAERALVIFLASLIPGLGERHIAAREAAEAALRQRQQDQENAQREQEQNDAQNRGNQSEQDGGATETAQVRVQDNATGTANDTVLPSRQEVQA